MVKRPIELVLAQAESRSARDDMAFTSLCGGLALANAGLGAVHGLAGVIGGRLGAPHGLICGRLLGPILLANRAALEAEGRETARFETVATWLGEALRRESAGVFAQLPQVLDGWGVARLGSWMTPQVDLERIAQEAAGASSMLANPCTLSQQALVAAMKAAI